MADDVYHRITIGGVISPAQADALQDALKSEFSEADGDDPRDVVAVQPPTTLLWAGQSRGEPSDVLDLCRKYGLTYRMSYEAGYEHSAGGEYWAPGMDKPDTFEANQDGSPLLTLTDLKRAIAEGPTAVAALADRLQRIAEAPLPALTPAMRENPIGLVMIDSAAKLARERAYYVLDVDANGLRGSDLDHDPRAIKREGEWRVYFETREAAAAELGLGEA